MTFRQAILHDAGERWWIEVEVSALKAHNPSLPDDLRVRSGVSNRSHALTAAEKNPKPFRLVQGDWSRVLTQQEAWLVWDVLGGLQALQHRLREFEETGG